jgi:hypothetical protein
MFRRTAFIASVASWCRALLSRTPLGRNRVTAGRQAQKRSHRLGRDPIRLSFYFEGLVRWGQGYRNLHQICSCLTNEVDQGARPALVDREPLVQFRAEYLDELAKSRFEILREFHRDLIASLCLVEARPSDPAEELVQFALRLFPHRTRANVWLLQRTLGKRIMRYLVWPQG